MITDEEFDAKLEAIKREKDRIFPVTDKSNHSISFEIWEKVLKKLGMEYKKSPFIYKGSGRKGTQIVLNETVGK